MLEPYDGKLSRTVLRREGGGNTADPADCIRFLTETESERLMGLPEGWTKYGADGVEIRPLQRYKALGNAIALPCADYIMVGIYEVLADRAGKEE